MINPKDIIQAKDFKSGLVTRSDIITPDTNQSPNCMDIKWYFDNTIGKRFGASTKNSIILTQTGNFNSWILDPDASLSNALRDYWNMDEVSGTRFDTVGTANLGLVNSPSGQVISAPGIRNLAAVVSNNSTYLRYGGDLANALLNTNGFTISLWFYKDGTGVIGPNTYLYNCENGQGNIFLSNTGGTASFLFSDTGNSATTVTNDSMGTLNNTWHNIIAWGSSRSHLGVSLDGQVTTAPFLKILSSPTGSFYMGFFTGTANVTVRLDETSIWDRVLSSSERASIYGGGTGNSYVTGTSTLNSWASFDFGATSLRWYTVAVGTGIVASSNLATTFVSIATSRTQSYQYFDRSKNVLIMTSDAQDPTLYWAGSAGTFAVTLSPGSAPNAKFNINYQGFLILLNGINRPRGFFYEDENTQIGGLWASNFDLPSSADDEITAPFILNKFLYISTRYKIFRLNYTGGNPDWQYIQVKNFGYVPRTVKVFTLKQGQVAVGLDWSRRLRAFDGYDDQILSDNVENDNNYCDFAMQKISLAGSGLLVSNAEFDPNQQEYRLNLSLGAQSTQTTHALVLNARTLSLYPYANQMYNTIAVAESAGKQFLMAVDRSGFVHILNSGNLDSVTPINEIYDSPLLFKNTPSEVNKNRQINFYFTPGSCGTVYFRERFDFSTVYTPNKPLKNYAGDSVFTGNEPALQIVRTVDLPSVQNVYQFSLISSAGTANPWKMTHFDLFNAGLGIGRGK